MSSQGFNRPETAYLNGRIPEACGDCGDDTIYPVDGSWEIVGTYTVPQKRMYRTLLACPNCDELKDHVVLDTTSQQGYDEVLRGRKQEIIDLLGALSSYNVKIDFDMLSEAIQSGNILPEDF